MYKEYEKNCEVFIKDAIRNGRNGHVFLVISRDGIVRQSDWFSTTRAKQIVERALKVSVSERAHSWFLREIVLWESFHPESKDLSAVCFDISSFVAKGVEDGNILVSQE